MHNAGATFVRQGTRVGKNEAKCDSRAQMPSMKVPLVFDQIQLEYCMLLFVIARCNYDVSIHMHIFLFH